MLLRGLSQVESTVASWKKNDKTLLPSSLQESRYKDLGYFLVLQEVKKLARLNKKLLYNTKLLLTHFLSAHLAE